MLFAIDIDGTVAGQPAHVIVEYLNQRLDLRISDSRLEEFNSSHDFLHSPEVQEWLTQSDARREHFNAVKYQSQFDPQVQQQSIVLPGAREAVQFLARLGRIIYITLRRPESVSITQDWLANNGFPSSENVFSCEHYQHKYLQSSRQAEEGEGVIIIDDNYRPLIARFKAFFDEYRDDANALRKRLAVVAYGAKEPPKWPFLHPAKPLFDIVTLSSWQDEEQFNSLIRGVNNGLVRFH